MVTVASDALGDGGFECLPRRHQRQCSGQVPVWGLGLWVFGVSCLTLNIRKKRYPYDKGVTEEPRW